MAPLLLVTDVQRSALRVGTTSRAYLPFGHCPHTHAYFTGQWLERPVGCYLLGNGRRGALPTLMRFASADALSPFGQGGLNAYAYCEAEPVNRIDPGGASWWDTLMGAGAGVLHSSGLKLTTSAKVTHRVLDTPLGELNAVTATIKASVRTSGRETEAVITSVRLGREARSAQEGYTYAAHLADLPSVVSKGTLSEITPITHGSYVNAAKGSIPLGTVNGRAMGIDQTIHVRLGRDLMGQTTQYVVAGGVTALAAHRGWKLARQAIRRFRHPQ